MLLPYSLNCASLGAQEIRFLDYIIILITLDYLCSLLLHVHKTNRRIPFFLPPFHIFLYGDTCMYGKVTWVGSSEIKLSSGDTFLICMSISLSGWKDFSESLHGCETSKFNPRRPLRCLDWRHESHFFTPHRHKRQCLDSTFQCIANYYYQLRFK